MIRISRRSTTLRLAVLVFTLQLIGGGAVLWTVRELTRTQIVSDAEDDAEQIRDDLLRTYQAGGLPAITRAASEQADLAKRPRTVILLSDAAGGYLAGNLADWPPTMATGVRRTMELYLIGRDASERMRIITSALPDGSRLLTGHVIEGELRVAGIMGDAMLIALLTALAFAGVASWATAVMIEGRLRTAVGTADAVAAGALQERVPLQHSGDAFDALAGSLNAMLDRIAQLMSEIRIATDGLAHDLRSPLTRLRASLDRALDKAGPDGRADVSRAMDESDRLLAMLDTALRITRAEAGLGREAFVQTDIAAIVEDMAEMYGPLAEDRGASIIVAQTPPVDAFAHRELLGQALANLIDNALKYGGESIRFGAVAQGDSVAIEIADRGPGIPAERRVEALRRFGRLDPARSERGAGLGLSLAAAVARLHGGSLDLRDNDPGLVVRLTIPREAGSGRMKG